MEINEIISHIMTKMTDTDELNHLKKVIDMKREDIARSLKHSLLPGDRVKVDSQKVGYGHIVKVNRTKVVVRDDNNQQWTVPLTMISTKYLEHKVR